jgi:hypothetical protein
MTWAGMRLAVIASYLARRYYENLFY